jgi:hypothetical protein
MWHGMNAASVNKNEFSQSTALLHAVKTDNPLSLLEGVFVNIPSNFEDTPNERSSWNITKRNGPFPITFLFGSVRSPWRWLLR